MALFTNSLNRILFLPAAELSGLRKLFFRVLVVKVWCILICPDEVLTLVPPLPHFGGGGILCPDEVLMVPLLPHFGGGGILFLFIFIIFWEFLVPPQVADAISILFQKNQRVRGGRLVSNMVSRLQIFEFFYISF